MQPLTLADFEMRARECLPAESLAFIQGGAGNERSLEANLAAYESLRLLPRVLKDVSCRSTETKVLGQDVSFPVLVAPSAMHRMADEDGEIATARATGDSGTIMVLSLGSSYPVEEVMDRASGPVWFQTYVGKDRAKTADVIGRAEAAGCQALVLTVDAPVVGGRTAELRSGFQVKPEWFASTHTPMYGLTSPVASGAGATELWDPSLSWDDIEWLRTITRLPLVLKGVMRADDAKVAADTGIEGLIVSNHGGRQLDSTPATIDVLPSIVEATEGRLEVLVDGGVRSGRDVLKSLALGARAVLVGRPVLWGLATDGQAGVQAVLELLSREFELTMALCGATTVDEITPDLIWTGENSLSP